MPRRGRYRGSPGRCMWPDCPGDIIWGRKSCRRHYQKMIRLGYTRGTFTDPAPVRARISEHVTRGRTVHDLAAWSGVAWHTLHHLALGHTTRVRVTTARKIMKVALPPTSVGAMRRYQALARLGYTVKGIAARMGMPRGTLSAALSRGLRTAYITVPLAAVYEELSHIPGPSLCSAARAEALGWPSAMAWEGIDIDDPDAVPDPGSPVSDDPWDEVDVLRFMQGDLRSLAPGRITPRGGWPKRLLAAQHEAIRRLTAAGRSVWWISEQVGCVTRTVDRVRAEHAAHAGRRAS